MASHLLFSFYLTSTQMHTYPLACQQDETLPINVENLEGATDNKNHGKTPTWLGSGPTAYPHQEKIEME